MFKKLLNFLFPPRREMISPLFRKIIEERPDQIYKIYDMLDNRTEDRTIEFEGKTYRISFGENIKIK